MMARVKWEQLTTAGIVGSSRSSKGSKILKGGGGGVIGNKEGVR